MMSSLITELLQSMGYALCEDRAGRRFALLYDPPPWFHEVWGHQTAGNLLTLVDRSPFLDAFLSEAKEHWSSDAVTPLASGIWVEQVSGGREIPLEARAWRIDGKRILSIHSPRENFEEQSRVLQSARDSLLVHERLLKEIQKKEILLHCIIHDLSQPLAAMRGCFDVLANETTSPAAKRLIDLGSRQSERQDAMIREVLQAFAMDVDSSMGAGEADAPAPSALECADETVAAFAPLFQSHGAKIRVHPRTDRRARWIVNGEKSRLARVFANLVENALRHAPKGSLVTIRLEDDAGYVKASVDDAGPGLPKDFKPSEAFALFSKGKEDGGKAGLGLYFCRMTVERWGGSIGCESLPHRGARFWFRLPPAARVESAPDPPRGIPARKSKVETSGAPRISGRLHILIADDDPAILELNETLIEREGHEVLAVDSGTEALRALARRRFEVVFLDEEMPGMSGVEVVKKIRASEASGARRQIVFALTGNSTGEDRARLLAAGFDACFSKPFRPDELHEAAARFSLGKPAPGAPHSTADSALLARVGGDEKLLRSITRTFLKDYPVKVAAIKQAIARNDAPALASAAHALKGAVAIFDATGAAESARDLQQMGRQGDLTKAAVTFRNLDEALASLNAKLREYAPPAKRHPSDSVRGKHPARKSRHRERRGPRH
ncbi:MAG TPA: response regulator [Candidatus Acidoferrales bacterium]|jgi:signal transduction histidine kinase/CheY-like chemotaxis protein|nr:response regulator [Candidatus Acidoferrales bacterium]